VVGNGHRAAGQAGAGAARHDRHLQFAANIEDGDDLLLGIGQRDHHRQLAVGGEAIAFIRTGILRVEQHAARGQLGAQRGNHGQLAGLEQRRVKGQMHEVSSGCMME
jgi:hypothetical protein